MCGLPRDGTAEPISRDQMLGHGREQGNIMFPVQLATTRIVNLTRLIHTTVHYEVSHFHKTTVCCGISEYQQVPVNSFEGTVGL